MSDYLPPGTCWPDDISQEEAMRLPDRDEDPFTWDDEPDDFLNALERREEL